jgi:pimeloyl-ACP methyl ester carboxylesterase
MFEAEAVVFENKVGQRLFGTLHLPPRVDYSLPAVILLSPGVKMRVGPGRLYVPLTEMLNAQGWVVLRFDFFGLGDSEGELEERLLADVYNHIEVGRYVDDALAAMDWMRSRGHRRFVLGGLCGGAITALLAAQRDSAVEGLLSIGMTVTLASNAATPAKYLTQSQLEMRRQGYYRRLLQPTSWMRFLTFQSEYGVIWRSIKQLLVGKEKPETLVSANVEAPEQRGNANPLFPTAFFCFLERGGRALMLFSEKDRLHSEYKEKFLAPFAARMEPFHDRIHQHVVPNANHVLSDHEWQREMVDRSRQWLSNFQPG